MSKQGTVSVVINRYISKFPRTLNENFKDVYAVGVVRLLIKILDIIVFGFFETVLISRLITSRGTLIILE